MFDLEQVTVRLMELVEEKNPKKVANYIYFIIKQFPDSPFCKEYEDNIRKTCNLVRNIFDWEDREIEEFVTTFRDLTQYIKK